VSIQIQIRRDSTANWVSKNPILAEGEIGYDLTENKFKVGDGTSTWTELEYSGVDEADLVTSVNSQKGDVVLSAADVGALTDETVSAGSGSTVSDIKIVIGKTGTDPNTLYFVV